MFCTYMHNMQKTVSNVVYYAFPVCLYNYPSSSVVRVIGTFLRQNELLHERKEFKSFSF